MRQRQGFGPPEDPAMQRGHHLRGRAGAAGGSSGKSGSSGTPNVIHGSMFFFSFSKLSHQESDRIFGPCFHFPGQDPFWVLMFVDPSPALWGASETFVGCSGASPAVPQAQEAQAWEFGSAVEGLGPFFFSSQFCRRKTPKNDMSNLDFFAWDRGCLAFMLLIDLPFICMILN